MSTSKKLVCPHCHAVNQVPAERLGDHPKCGKCKQPIFTGRPVELNDANFQKFISKNDVPVVVDFWAEWCGPCKMMAPAFSEAAAQLEPDMLLAKLNTEMAQQSAARFGIRSIPTMIAFKQGQEIARQSGAMNTQQIIQWVRQL